MGRLVIGIIFLLVALGLVIAGHRKMGYDKVDVNFRKWAWIPAIVGVLFLAWSTVRIVDAGEVGIPVTFGTVGEPLEQGVAFTNPFATVNKMSVRTENYTASGDAAIEVLGRDGATAGVHITLLYHLDEGEAGNVFRNVGTNYVDKLVHPSIRSCVRDVFAQLPIVEAATGSRGNLSIEIEKCLVGDLEERGIVVEQLQLRDIILSETVQNSINLKVEAEQRALQQKFELETAEQIAEIKRVEAQGIADSEQIIKCGAVTSKDDEGNITVTPKEGASCEDNLTPEYLSYQQIQMFEKLLESGNTNTVILPFDQSLQPILPLPSGAGG